MAPIITPGAPGIYTLPATSAEAPAGERMDVCGFVGVAPRGPAREPVRDEEWPDDRPCVEPERPRRRSVAVAVESMDEYHRLYGGFDGPGRLPFAVAAFFAQGGRRAYVVRVVHEYDDASENAGGVASGVLGGATASEGTLRLHARSEGAWGNRLRAALGHESRPVALMPGSWHESTLVLEGEAVASPGTLLRLRHAGGAHALRFVIDTERRWHLDPGTRREGVRVTLDRALDAPPISAEIVEGALLLDDGDGRREQHSGLGLASGHPRWMATVLCNESELVYPDPSWMHARILPAQGDRPQVTPILPELGAGRLPQFTGGEDRYRDIVHDDFFDARWDPRAGVPGAGVHALGWLLEPASLVVPDLYVPEPLPEALPPQALPPLAPSGFVSCAPPPPPLPEPVPEPPDLPGLHLDPQRDLPRIIELQRRLVRFVEERGEVVVLLDVPPGLSQRQILAWRAEFQSSYAAAYHPWLRMARFPGDVDRPAPVLLNPSAAAAGIIAHIELARGIAHGPAQVVVSGAVAVDDTVSAARHGELHQAGINVCLREHRGVLLTAARTLSADASLRQLSVRRLMIMLRRLLLRQTQWAVFEPNGPELATELGSLVRGELRRLYGVGAFRGASEEEAFFVRHDEPLNTARTRDAGQLIVEIGVAPAEPLEFLVLRIVRGDNGALVVEV